MNAVREWPTILQFGTGETISETLVEKKYRQLAKKYHPDAGGTDAEMQELNHAKQLALAWIVRERQRLVLAERQTRQAPNMEAMHRVAQQYSAANQQQTAWWMNGMGGLGAASAAQGMADVSRAMADFLGQTKPKGEIKPEPKKTLRRRLFDAVREFLREW